MNRILKWILIILGVLVVLLSLMALYFTNKFERARDKDYSVTPATVIIPTDSASIERGRIVSVGCRNCHGVDLAGSAFFDEPTIGRIISSNLTRAKGSQTENYSDQDFVKAIRHGLNPQNKALMIMPSDSYCFLSDTDLGCLIAFIKTIPAKQDTFGASALTFMSNIMAGAGMFGELFPANKIDHVAAANIASVPLSDSLRYGEYMVKVEGCKSCHGLNLAGGISPDPVSPPVPNITTSGNFGKWDAKQFRNIFRTGTTPEGKVLDGKFMPFAGIGAYSDAEINTIYAYIKSLPGMPDADIK
ncbi:MAG: c-type cytochrome [Saprospiraceae bacterium]|nr:c-type cytochrome [Saprospiraceae bacterium]